MSDGSHVLKSFDASLDGLLQDFKRMGALTARNCTVATEAYLTSDNGLALETVNRDLDIDTAFEDLRAGCFDVLLRFQPVARDLRLVMGIEHAVGDLERAGDHAKNIARRVISNPAPILGKADAAAIESLSKIVSKAIELSVTALIDRSHTVAKQVIAADTKIDAHNDAIFDAAMVALKRHPAQADRHVQRLFVSKALERVGDHATNFAEEVLFLTRGVPPGATRTGQDFS
ncbi:MAG: phosphate signaling complex protein PhoU [Loktanella sp.]|nr:phosphate signaling complex protein PhoU [Loktanella sp.]